ncbi:MAG: glycosyltransferase [Aquaticitalea sp.]
MNNKKKNLSILVISMGSGGAEKVISLLLKELKNDFNVTLVLFYDVIHFDIPEEVEVVVLSKNEMQSPFYSKLMDFLKFASQYNKLIKQKKIDISVSFLATPNLVNGMIAKRNKNVKTILSERGYPSDNTTSKLSLYISRIFYPIYYNKCTRLFSNSVHINNDLRDNFGVKIPMEVIYNPMEIPEQVIDTDSLGISNKFYKIITAGTLNVRKNHRMIIKALQMMPNDYELNILGEGPLENQLLEQIKDTNLDKNVVLVGKVKNVNDYLVKSHCFVLSSFTEGFPNALLEAMAVGLPCISTNCLSGPLEMLNENVDVTIEQGGFIKAKYGILINNDDSKGLINALKFLEDNPEIRVNYSTLGLQRSKDYQLKSIYSEFFKFINVK